MNRDNLIQRSLADRKSACSEWYPGLPLVEICGQRRVLIENHRGIIGYDSCEIIVNVKSGHISICGENLILTKMSKEKLVITGCVHSVSLHGRGAYETD